MTVSDADLSPADVMPLAPEPRRGRAATSLFLRQGGRIGPVIVAAVTVVFAVEATKLNVGTLAEPGPAMWPLIISGLTFLLSLIAACARPDIPALVRRSGLVRVAVYIAGFLAVVVLYQPLGFILSGAIFCFALLKVAAGEKWILSISLSVIAPVLVYVVFGVFLELPIVAWP